MDFIKTVKKTSISARIGMVMVFVTLLAALLAPVVAPYEEAEVVADVWLPPGEGHILGTDQLGRDLFTRMLYGARNTIAIALLITFLAFLVGVISGLLAATVGGWVDMLLSRIVDVFMAFPALILSLMVLSILGSSIPVLIVVIALLDSTKVYRLTRALAMDIEVMEFVEVARLSGEGIWWIITKEILPNALPALIAEFGLRFCFIFLFISALSFLGLGIQPPAADWGSMVRDNAGAISFDMMTPLWPAGAIAFLTIGINLIVDWFLHRSVQIRAH
ncbi:MAG: ABC transporter permease [Desulfosarcina sp.]|nr:ABC transporter permease [Desulfosarcina sp.]MBC2764754.1 ABC transporter permease [Desulfosarcina sp.]